MTPSDIMFHTVKRIWADFSSLLFDFYVIIIDLFIFCFMLFYFVYLRVTKGQEKTKSLDLSRPMLLSTGPCMIGHQCMIFFCGWDYKPKISGRGMVPGTRNLLRWRRTNVRFEIPTTWMKLERTTAERTWI